MLNIQKGQAIRVCSTNGEGRGFDDSVPGEVSKIAPSGGIGLHDSLHGRQACPEFNSFKQGGGQIYPR